jgi:small subunit ribosomal protein S20
MPVKKAAFKDLRQSKQRANQNAKWRSDIDAIVRRVQKAIAANDPAKAQDWLRQALKKIDRAAQRRVIKKNTANRKKSRLQISVGKLTKK